MSLITDSGRFLPLWCLEHPVYNLCTVSPLSFYNRAMITAAEYGETSWELSVQVDQKDGDESMKFKLRVKGDLHIGGLMLKLVEKISKCLRLVENCCTMICHCNIACTVCSISFRYPWARHWTPKPGVLHGGQLPLHIGTKCSPLLITFNDYI